MTSLSRKQFVPHKRLNIQSPLDFDYQDISVVIPVKNNQLGIENFFKEFFNTQPQANYPREVIVVDNNSEPPIFIREEHKLSGLTIRLLTCNQIGPASARNLGLKHSTGNWIVFTDSDCIPTESFLTGYKSALNGAVGYAGNIQALGNDNLSKYYQVQGILIPPPVKDELGISRPYYLITANTLIWKPALELIGGFDEHIPIAAGEDIDLGFRLQEIGELSYATRSLVYHDFGAGYISFIQRFFRYGQGNRLVALKHDIDMKPQPFKPAKSTIFHSFLSIIQYLSLLHGYGCEFKILTSIHNN